MAGVAKWLRQWIVVPPFAGSTPVVRPFTARVSAIRSLALRNTSIKISIKLGVDDPHFLAVEFASTGSIGSH